MPRRPAGNVVEILEYVSDLAPSLTTWLQSLIPLSVPWRLAWQCGGRNLRGLGQCHSSEAVVSVTAPSLQPGDVAKVIEALVKVSDIVKVSETVVSAT